MSLYFTLFSMNIKSLFFCFFIVAPCFSQNATLKSNQEFRDKMSEKAKKDIQELKEGVLLVRINSRSKEINYYKKYANFKKANSIETKTKAFNKELIKAFRASIDICPVYFFEDTFSTTIFTGDIDKVIFYTDSLTLYPTLKISKANFFIAELGVTEGDTTGFRNDYFISTNENGTSREARMYKEGNLNISAFVIRDRRFVMLHGPFPYYAKIMRKTPSFQKMTKKLLVWNQKMKAFN